MISMSNPTDYETLCDAYENLKRMVTSMRSGVGSFPYVYEVNVYRLDTMEFSMSRRLADNPLATKDVIGLINQDGATELMG